MSAPQPLEDIEARVPALRVSQLIGEVAADDTEHVREGNAGSTELRQGSPEDGVRAQRGQMSMAA